MIINWLFKIFEFCFGLDWLKNSFGLIRWGFLERKDWIGFGLVFLILKVLRLLFFLFCIRKFGLGGRGMLFREILFIFFIDLLLYICGGLNIFLNVIVLELNGFFEECELVSVFFLVLKWSFIFEDGCCDVDGWNISEFYCWYIFFCCLEFNVLLNYIKRKLFFGNLLLIKDCLYVYL